MIKFLQKIVVSFIVVYAIFYFVPFSFVYTKPFYFNHEKLWKHRFLNPVSDSLQINEFKGFEVDVFYNSEINVFEVKYYGDESKFTLSEYFNYFGEDKCFWIDFKNLNEKNFKESYKKLKEICANKNLKERVFVESKNMDLLNYFQINGFSVSYWVPNYHFFGSLTTSFQVRMNLLKYQPDAISCNFNSLHFYTKKFPNYNFYCWVNKMSKESDKSRIIKKAENENIRIILTDFDENFLSTQ